MSTPDPTSAEPYLHGQKPTVWGSHLFHLFSICLGAAISFLPATYLLLLLRTSSLGLNYLSLSLVWVLLGMILLWEYWKAARLNWNHGMIFKPLWLLYPYLVVSSIFVFTLVMLPVTVGVRAYLSIGKSPTMQCSLSHLAHGLTHCPNAFQSLQPLVWTLMSLQVLSAIATGIKFRNQDVLNSTAAKRSTGAELSANVFCLLFYVMWLAYASSISPWTDVVALMAIYVFAEIVWPRVFHLIAPDGD